MKFSLTIELGNNAMQTGSDIADALRGVVSGIGCHDELTGCESARILDANGNSVGRWEATE